MSDEGRLAWLAEQALFGRLRTRGPRVLGDSLAAATRALRLRWPSTFQGLLHAKMRLRGAPRGALDGFLAALHGADVVVIGGQASLNDTFVGRAGTVLSTLEAAMALGKRTALVGQGIGPLLDPRLRLRARAILPRADVICLREERTGRPLLEELGVDPSRIELTGDDALELAADPRSGLAARIGRSASTCASRRYAGTDTPSSGACGRSSSPRRGGATRRSFRSRSLFTRARRDVGALRVLLAGRSPRRTAGRRRERRKRFSRRSAAAGFS